MALTYPVDLQARYDVWDRTANAMAATNRDWPRADGGPLVGAPDNLVPLLRVLSPNPSYNHATQKLGPVADPVIDLDASTSTYVRTVIDMTQEEIDAKAAADAQAAANEAELEQIRAVYLALKNGTGTAGERLTRLERVVARMIRDQYAP